MDSRPPCASDNSSAGIQDAGTPFEFLAQKFAVPGNPLRRAIAERCRVDEAKAFAELTAMRPRTTDEEGAETEAMALRLTARLRAERRNAGGMQALMHEFDLSTQEGMALMCLAEALLRIPDAATADRLIAEKVRQGDWQSHSADSPSLFVNAAAWGLMLTGRLLSTPSPASLSGSLSALVARFGEPIVRKAMDLAMRLLGNQFVAGPTIGEALRHTRHGADRGYRYSFDMLGEAALTEDDAARYAAAYEDAIRAVGDGGAAGDVIRRDGVSVKLSALHPRYAHAQKKRVMAELLPRLRHLVRLARHVGVGLQLDAEEAVRLEVSLDLLEALMTDPELKGFDGIGFVVQAYQKRAPAVVDYLADLSLRSGRRIMVRLVKGAYWDTEIKRAQEDGLSGYPVWTRKSHTDACYLVCADKLLAAAPRLIPQFATHNAHTVAAVLHRARRAGVAEFEFQCLYGMGEPLYDSLVNGEHSPALPPVPCRIYAPVGEHRSLLAYLVRRLLENGANSSFIHRILDDSVPMASLVADPFDEALATGGTPHPAIPLPRDLFGVARRNSAGRDLHDDTVLAELASALRQAASSPWQAAPMIDGPVRPEAAEPRYDPADHRRRIGTVRCASLQDVESALNAAVRHAGCWARLDPAHRRRVLEDAADQMEAAGDALTACIVLEAGRTLSNAVAEVREAVDFLRYYASRSCCHTSTPWGVVACISPWNFPLAIFIGQIAGALAAGNVVLAKPAEQTPGIAAAATRILHQAGVPRAALQLLPGLGETVGAWLVSDLRVRGVLFTGSNAVAAAIHRTLAERMANEGGELPLIAETGGQNAMIVDSSALPEQVVQDALVSAFDSAGQRCSSLRILCLQEDIAEPVLQMLAGALRERAVGHPADPSTDIGPLIDGPACARVRRHVDAMASRQRVLAQPPLSSACRHGDFIAPAVIEIASVAELTEEIFGPVLHVLRYARESLPDLIDALNRTGYALTVGIQSRIDGTVDDILARIRAGNCYVNRNMIGAAVGVQPFGGEGLSGTGPKAGGPLYLCRLQQGVVTIPLARMPPQAAVTPQVEAARRAWSAWLDRNGHAGQADRFADHVRGALTGTAIELPGPTGERNTLSLRPKGEILCVADSVHSALHQLGAVIATGNTALVTPDTAEHLPPDLPEAVERYVRRLTPAQADGAVPALALADAAMADAVRSRLAGRSDQIIAVVPVTEDPIPIWRLCGERTVTVNLAACGGNMALMRV